MSNEARLSTLIVQHLERLVGTREKDEVSELRAFLGRWHSVKGSRATLVVELGVKIAKANMVVVYAYAPGIGAVSWFPAIVIPNSPHVDRMLRESGCRPLAEYDPERERDAWGRVEPRRPPVLPTVRVQMIGR